MMDALDFNSFAELPSAGDNRIAVWDWTGLRNLTSGGCGSCNDVKFGGQLFTGTVPYYDPDNRRGWVLSSSESGRSRWVTNAAPPA